MESTLVDVELPSRLPRASPHLRGVVGIPSGEGPWPGVVMVHEAFGLNDTMRRQVERMAAAGFLVLMPDLFVEGGPRKCLRSTFRDILRGEGRSFDDVETARRFLVAREDCTGRIGVLGFCMGGGFALMAAKGKGFGAVSANYGVLPRDIDATLAGACPIVASYGRRDLTLRGSAKKLEAALTRLDVPHDVVEYPTAGHSFLDDTDEDTPAFLRPLLRVVLGAGPDPAATADAWRRIDGFFRKHLAEA
ncbi:dienelactone hydrolase family protein [Naasia aerilata]|uniref:Carboxymethylenebutenolidase n=1 Tax=Naasia aerilata TaxID=1162966 RepID=A0ABM8GFM1_9MICO|nr:dienelactone hydrolase family protein [Naasia aerilata]BDZ47142.1 carboxymethylenebutenolidase [Naasia aerilata]